MWWFQPLRNDVSGGLAGFEIAGLARNDGAGADDHRSSLRVRTKSFSGAGCRGIAGRRRTTTGRPYG